MSFVSRHLPTRRILEPKLAESTLFEMPVFSAAVKDVADVDRVIDEAIALPASLIVVRVPVESVSAVQHLERSGGQLCDVLVTMRYRVPDRTVPECLQVEGATIRQGGVRDVEVVRKIAGQAFHNFVGHWHSDARIPARLSDALYSQWAGDLARHSSASLQLYIADGIDGMPMGFLALRKSAELHWHVPLAAVGSRFRGRGVLGALITRAMRDVVSDGNVIFDYETQLSNRAALHAVARLGFIPTSSRLTFHLWASSK